MRHSMFRHPARIAVMTGVVHAVGGAAAPAWGQCQFDKFFAEDAAALDVFGQAIAIDENLVAIGAPGVSPSSIGSAYVFKRVGTEWIQSAVVTASDGVADDEFGHSVAICGDFLAVGARLDDDDGESSGSAYVFQRSGDDWLEVAKLTASAITTKPPSYEVPNGTKSISPIPQLYKYQMVQYQYHQYLNYMKYQMV